MFFTHYNESIFPTPTLKIILSELFPNDENVFYFGMRNPTYALYGYQDYLVICMVGNYIATIVSETKVAEEVFGLNNADLFNVQTGYIQC